MTQYIPLTLSTLFYLLGYLSGVAAFAWLAYRRKLATQGIWILAYTALLGGLIGANVGQWLLGGTPGKSILGGIVGGWLSVLVAKRVMGLRRPTGDLFAFGMAAGEAVGRWGCFVGGCCYGKPAQGLLWGVHQHDMWRHPTQIYLSLAAFAVFWVLLSLEMRRILPENGLFYVQGILFALSRFVIEFYRDGASPYAGLTTAQVVCIPLFIILVVLLIRLGRTPESGVPKEKLPHESVAVYP